MMQKELGINMELPIYLKNYIINNTGYLSGDYQRRNHYNEDYLPEEEWARQYPKEAEKFVKEFWEGKSKKEKLAFLDQMQTNLVGEIRNRNNNMAEVISLFLKINKEND